MPTEACRITRLPSRSSRLRCERSIRTAMWVVLVRSPSRFSQPSVPFGMSVLVTPIQWPRLAATARVVPEPNCVVDETWAITRPPGFERSATVRPGGRWTIEKVGCGLGAGFGAAGPVPSTFSGGASGTAGATRGAGAAAVVDDRWERALYAAETAISPSMATSSTTTICVSDGRGISPLPSSTYARVNSARGRMFYCAAPALKQHVARLKVRADLALHALQRVVDRLRVAREPLGDRLVRVPVEVERQHRALELGKDARQTRHQAVQLLARDHLVHGVVRDRPGEDLVERRLRVAGRGRGGRERHVLVERRVLVAGRRLHRRDDLARDAQLREVAEARLAVGAVVANRLVEPDEPLLDEVVGVAADQEVGRRLEAHEAVVATDDPIIGIVPPSLGKRDEVVIIYLYLRLSYTDVTQRRGSGHGDTPPGSDDPVGAAPLTSPGKRQTRFSSRPGSKLKLNSSLICARSMSALWSVVNQKCPEMQDSVQDSRRGRRHVE